jgi:hypothetical protein
MGDFYSLRQRPAQANGDRSQRGPAADARAAGGLRRLQRVLGNRAIQRLASAGASGTETGKSMSELARIANAGASGGSPLPDSLRGKFETSFGTDLSDLRLHVGAQAPAIGARAYARGRDIYFAPGEFDPFSVGGQQLIGHEVAHTLQQRAGRVSARPGAAVPINTDPSLEAEAERLGARAARGEAATFVEGSRPVASNTSPVPAPIQGLWAYDVDYDVWLDVEEEGSTSRQAPRYRYAGRPYAGVGGTRHGVGPNGVEINGPLIREIKDEPAENDIDIDILDAMYALTKKARKERVTYNADIGLGVLKRLKGAFALDIDLGAAADAEYDYTPLLFNTELSRRRNPTIRAKTGFWFWTHRDFQASCITLASYLEHQLKQAGLEGAEARYVLGPNDMAIVPVPGFFDPNLRGNLADEDGNPIDMNFVFRGHMAITQGETIYDPLTEAVFTQAQFDAAIRRLTPVEGTQHEFTIQGGFDHNGQHYTRLRRRLGDDGVPLVNANMLSLYQLVPNIEIVELPEE